MQVEIVEQNEFITIAEFIICDSECASANKVRWLPPSPCCGSHGVVAAVVVVAHKIS